MNRRVFVRGLEQPTKFDGLTIPPSLLLRTDQVIE